MMVEVDIHCNVIQCRKPLSLENQACVTSCSHIFCIHCSNELFSKSLSCPACNTTLSENDDIILTELNPTEEYKSSILAGLKPELILDISTRAIAFYEYQTSQEIIYRSMVQKNIEEKYSNLKNQFNIATRDLNHILKSEREKHSNLVKDLESEKSKYQQILYKLDEKSKQFQKLQMMYEKLKRKAMINTAQIQKPMITYKPSENNQSNSKIGLNKNLIFMPIQSPSVIQSIYPISSNHETFHPFQNNQSTYHHFKKNH